jgi:glycosyltransferase involved in cell wall biosynthesis
MIKVCLITSYKQPNYIRAKTLRTAFKNIKDVELIVVKNKHTGFLRYFEVLGKLIKARIARRPDLYFITFRGYEILPFVRIITLGKPLIFDEFINLVEWIVYEHHKIKQNSLMAKILANIYRFWLNTAKIITTDTSSHARFSSNLMNIPIDKYVPLTVSADEQTFSQVHKKITKEDNNFKVFYYGSMLPLHGVEVVIAMKLLKDQPIELTLIGGKEKIKEIIKRAKEEGANINYKSWVSFNSLPKYMWQSDICLGGPFGGTVQARYVITGKTLQLLQMGCPVIIGSNNESALFTDKKSALIIEQSNPEALAGAILWAKQHQSQLEKIGLVGKELYEDKFSNKILTKQLEELLTNKHIL